MNVLIEFLEFIDATPTTRVHDLLDRVLFKSRRLTGAEAGSIFIVRRNGRRKLLESMSIQNDRVDMAAERFTIPIDSKSIAGHVARSGKTVRLADVHHLPNKARFRFNPSIEREYPFELRSMLCFPL